MSESLGQHAHRPLANLIIAGVNRSATTSIFTYLAEHPDICPSTIKETNYFLPVLQGGALEPIDTYAEYFKDGVNKKYRMEASPAYIFGGAKLAQAIYKYLGPVRVVFILRDPVTRMVSYFHQRKHNGDLPTAMCVDEYAQRALEELPAAQAAYRGEPIDVYRESVFTRGLAQGFYADYLKAWYEVFPQTIHISFFEHIRQNSRQAVEELCRWLGLEMSISEKVEFTQENRTVEHRNTALFNMASRINDRFEPFWREHKNIKRWLRSIYFRFNEEHFGDAPLSGAMIAELENAYASGNQRLHVMLSQAGYRELPAWITGTPKVLNLGTAGASHK